MLLRLLPYVGLPIFFLSAFDFYLVNNCCSDSAVFSPEHKIGVYCIMMISIISYGITVFRKNLFPPILEVLLNIILLLGLIFNIILIFQINTSDKGIIFWGLGNIPIIILFLLRLIQNHKLQKEYIIKNEMAVNTVFGKTALGLLNSNSLIKFPVLVLLLIPLLILISLFLILFGQKPDSLIQAFTQTYKHGFSQLDFMCDNVECGGHFLCSVGANGHKNIVKPIRYGERNGAKIICNRQLLVSNAFEDLMQEKFPKLHLFIRKKYNKVGDVVHKYYDIFNIKWISDVIYLLMKPLEWLFLITLYSFDKNPENRIEKQYLSKKDNIKMKELIKNN